MNYALVDTKKEKAKKGARGLCPMCNADVIAKCGDIYAHHWSHLSAEECDTWHEPMTQWHIDWQDVFSSEGHQVEKTIRRNGKVHRADVVTKSGVVIEFQHSSIISSAIAEREAFYGEKMIWVIDGDDFKGRIDVIMRSRIHHDLSYSGTKVRVDWKHARRSWDVSNACRFIDISKRPYILNTGIYTHEFQSPIIFLAKNENDCFIVEKSDFIAFYANGSIDNLRKKWDAIIEWSDNYQKESVRKQISARIEAERARERHGERLRIESEKLRKKNKERLRIKTKKQKYRQEMMRSCSCNNCVHCSRRWWKEMEQGLSWMTVRPLTTSADNLFVLITNLISVVSPSLRKTNELCMQACQDVMLSRSAESIRIEFRAIVEVHQSRVVGIRRMINSTKKDCAYNMHYLGSDCQNRISKLLNNCDDAITTILSIATVTTRHAWSYLCDNPNNPRPSYHSPDTSVLNLIYGRFKLLSKAIHENLSFDYLGDFLLVDHITHKDKQ